MQDPGSPSWGISPEYQFEDELLQFGRGPFLPELMRLYWDEDAGGIRPDFVGLSPSALATTPENWAEFSEVTLNATTKFEYRISNETYLNLRADTFLELLDESRSDFRVTRSGNLVSPKYAVLTGPPPSGVHIFALSFRRRRKSIVFVTSQFKREYNQAGFRGLKFQEAWPCNLTT